MEPTTYNLPLVLTTDQYSTLSAILDDEIQRRDRNANDRHWNTDRAQRYANQQLDDVNQLASALETAWDNSTMTEQDN